MERSVSCFAGGGSMGDEGMIEVKAEVKRHFEQFFSESDLSRPVLAT